jgi:hypothetical protein
MQDAVDFAQGFIEAEWADIRATLSERDGVAARRAGRAALKYLARGFDILVTSGMRSYDPGPEFWEEAPRLLAQFRKRTLFAVARSEHPSLGSVLTFYVSGNGSAGAGLPDWPQYRYHATGNGEERRIVARDSACMDCRVRRRVEPKCGDCSGRGWVATRIGLKVHLPAPAEYRILRSSEDDWGAATLASVGTGRPPAPPAQGAAVVASGGAPESGAGLQPGFAGEPGARLSWLRDVLLGHTSVDAAPDDRHALDTVFGYWHRGEPWRSQLSRDFAELLQDPDPRLCGAAVHFFVDHAAADDGGALLSARRFHAVALEGVRSPWYPDERDLRELLSVAIAHRLLRSPPHREAAREDLLVPGRAGSLVNQLFSRDPEWFRDHVAEILLANPGAAGVPLGYIAMAHRVAPADGETHMRNLAGALSDAGYTFPEPFLDALARAHPEGLATLLATLHARGVDLRPLLRPLAARFPPEALRAAILGLPDGLEKMAYLALL